MPTLLTETWNKQDESTLRNKEPGINQWLPLSFWMRYTLEARIQRQEDFCQLAAGKVRKGRLRIHHHNQTPNVKNSRNFHYFNMSNKNGRAGGANEWISYEENVSTITGVGFLPSIVWTFPNQTFISMSQPYPKQKNYPLTTMRLRLTLSFLFAPLELSPGSFASPTAPQSRNRWKKLPLSGNQKSNRIMKYFADKLYIIRNDPYKRDHPIVSSSSCVVTKEQSLWYFPATTWWLVEFYLKLKYFLKEDQRLRYEHTPYNYQESCAKATWHTWMPRPLKPSISLPLCNHQSTPQLKIMNRYPTLFILGHHQPPYK